jgi:hypothetical protein
MELEESEERKDHHGTGVRGLQQRALAPLVSPTQKGE